MKVALIKPKVNGTRPNIERVVHMIGGTLPVLAAYTPSGVELQAFDESLSPIDFNQRYDLVGITVMTPAAPRAYQLADYYRSLGTKVVLGGAHITSMPQEALEHADAVSIFNGEKTWPRIVEDAQKGELKRVYQSDFSTQPGSSEPSERKLPRRDILRPQSLSKAKFLVESVATSVGCVYTCKFCMIPVMYDRKHIANPTHSVIEDIKRVPSDRIYLNDDNFMGNPKAAEELFKAMIELQKERKFEWYSQSTIVLGKRPELATLARKSGCRAIYIGFESVNEMSIKNDVGKGCNHVREYHDAIKVLQDNGIRVEGGFVFGFEHDDITIFERTLEFVDKVGLDSVNPHILTPHPGTQVYKDLMAEGRIFAHGEWEKFYTGKVVFTPQNMLPEQLQEGYDSFCQEAFSLSRIASRSIDGFHIGGLRQGLETLLINMVGKPVV